MSTTVTLQSNATGVARALNPSSGYTPGGTYTIADAGDLIFFTFTAPSSSLKYNVIDQMILQMYANGEAMQLRLNSVSKEFTPGSVSINNQPTINSLATSYFSTTSSNPDHTLVEKNLTLDFGTGYYENVIKYGLRAKPYSSAYVGKSVYTAYSIYNPRLVVTFGDEKFHCQPIGTPSSGFVDPRNDIVLSWSNTIRPLNTHWLEKPEQLAAVVCWREVDGETTTLPAVFSDQSVTIPADTWSLNKNYQWKVVVTDTGGSSTDSGWYTLTTIEENATPPTLVSPEYDIMDGSKPIEFTWIDNGRGTYEGTDLSFSDDGTTWGDPVFVAANLTTYSAPAGTFTSGVKYWRARSYSPTSVAGNWSDPFMFTVIASPAAPYYTITNTPRPTISWTSDEQEAFQVQFGDYYDTGLVFGRATSFKCPVYLPDGDATVRVRVMNQYNLWSDWSGTQITIANTPGDAPPVLTVTAGVDAQLSWTDVEASRYLIYRDGELIGETTGLSFTDPYANGQASYFVRAEGARTTQTIALIDDSYINTNNPSGYVKIDSPTAAADTWSYAQVACQEGDRFLVTATGSNGYHLAYTFAKADKSKVAPTASTNTGYTNEELTAPADAAWLVVNANMSNERSLKKIVHQAADYYTDSNTVSVTIAVPCPMICAMDGGWIELRYSTEPIYTSQETHTQQVSMMVWSGAVYPEAEIGPHRQRSYQIDVAFRPGESAPFEALLGREVFLKDQYGARLHGVMAAIATARNRFYTVCSATLEEMEGSL